MSESDGRMDFWWDDETQQYVSRNYGPQPRSQEPRVDYIPTAKKKLEDAGTRFRHLSDFQEYLSDGIVAVGNSLSRYKNDADSERLKILDSALNLLKVYQYNLAEYDSKKFDFNQMLDSCVPAPGILDEIKKDRKAAAERAKASAITEALTGDGQHLPSPGQSPDTD